MSFLIDIVLLAVLIFSFIYGCKKGFIKSVQKISALVLTIVLVIALKDTAVGLLSESKLAGHITESLSDKISIPQGGGVNIAENLNLPEFIQPQINAGLAQVQETASSVNDAAVKELTMLFITVIACVGLFIIIRLLIEIAFFLAKGVARAPVISGINKLLGGLLAMINAVFIIFLLLSLVSLFAPADSGLFEAINNTFITQYLYNYNILLQLFMKI